MPWALLGLLQGTVVVRTWFSAGTPEVMVCTAAPISEAPVATPGCRICELVLALVTLVLVLVMVLVVLLAVFSVEVVVLVVFGLKAPGQTEPTLAPDRSLSARPIKP